MQSRDPAHVRLDPPQLVTVDSPEAGYTVRMAAALELAEPSELALVGRHDDLATALCRDARRVAELVHQPCALHAQARLERTRLVVDPRVDHAAVPGCLRAAHIGPAFKHDDARARP